MLNAPKVAVMLDAAEVAVSDVVDVFDHLAVLLVVIVVVIACR